MATLLLVRHGNTFEAGETSTFVGGKTDMKLTATGEEQGRAIAAMIAAHDLPLGGVISGPLVRTRRFAEMIAQAASTVFTIDERLCEIDYGLWENKSSDEVKALYGASIVEQWEKDGVWPEDMNWAPSEAKLIRNVDSLLAEQHKKLSNPKTSATRVIVTSNGILRYVYRSITGKAPDKAAKVGTGCFCRLETEGEGWTIKEWNAKPA